MVYLMLVVGVCISAYGIVLIKKEMKERELISEEKEEVIFNEEDIYNEEDLYENEDVYVDGYAKVENDNDKEVENNKDFNEIIKEKMSSIDVQYDKEKDEKIYDKLNKIEEMLKPVMDTSDREKKLLLFEKELIKRERAIKRNETRIDKLVEAKMKTISKTKGVTTKKIVTASGDTSEMKSRKTPTATGMKRSSTVSNSSQILKDKLNVQNENDKNTIIQKINALEEEGKSLEDIASQLSLGKGEVLLLRSIQRQ
ncbi:hypothetical protein [Clostridium sp. DL1XJH146]